MKFRMLPGPSGSFVQNWLESKVMVQSLVLVELGFG
jgi:hypothetical protein